MEVQKTKIVKGFEHINYTPLTYKENEMLKRSLDYFNWLNKRRTVREFSQKTVSKKIIENIILSASTAHSGAHKQPWTFCAISNSKLKSKIRKAAELEEKLAYEVKMSRQWKEDLAPIGTDMFKPFIEEAPWIIVAFKRIYEIDDKGKRYNNYYVNESLGIACGMMISAIHNAGLVTLTHTPNPMNFLTEILNRPANERAFILFPVGYANEDVYVPNLKRKKLEDVSCFFE